jgi:TonB-linked SusC/RagA family outer membrane protein
MSRTHFLLRKAVVAILLLLLPAFLFAQNQISGKVVGKEGQAVNGLTVLVKGTNKGTSTSEDGTFKIVANPGDVLVVSGVNVAPTEFTVGANGEAVIDIQSSASALAEVVVTALGVKKETKRLGYSVQEVKGSDLVKARESNPVNGLVGKVSGLDVAISKEMLAAPAVSLRGGNITLYVVDGIPITSDTWNISPDDIETYTVLKGLAATALYGSRAQNGAILITTKRGKRNAKGYTIEYNTSFQVDDGFIAVPRTQSLYGPGERNQYRFGDGKGGGLNDGDYDVWGPKFEGQLLPQYDSPIDPATGIRTSTPWIARGANNMENFIQAGQLWTNNLSFSTATDRATIRMSLSHSHQKGIVPNTKLDISNFNVNTTYDLTSRLKVEAGLNYNKQYSPNTPDVNYGPNSLIYSLSVWTGADYDVNELRNYWQPGKEGIQSIFAEYQRYQNPWFMSYEWLRGHYKTDVVGNAGLSYRLNDNWDFQLRTNVTTYDLLRTEKMPYSAHPYGREENKGDYREDRRSLFDNNVEGLVKYHGQLTKGIALEALAGGNARNFTYNSSFVTTDYLNVPGLYNFNNSMNPVKAYSYNSKMFVLSAYYSVNLDFGKFLSLSTTGRVDKNSSLREDNNSYFYPSVSLATAISDYINMPDFISFLKARASYATAKSPSTSAYIGPAGYPLGYGAPYTTVYGGPSYGLADPSYGISPVYNNQSGANASTQVIDPNVKSSELTSTEFGLDVKFMNNRLGLSATYFSNIKGPGIVNLPISQTSGLTSIITNAIKTKIDGLELSLMGTPVKSDNGFQWDVLVNWSTFKEVYKELPSNFETYRFKQGDRVDKIYATLVAKTPDGQPIHDADGFPIFLPKAQYMGNADVDWSWAINNRFSYKTFSLSFQFDGKVGGRVQDNVMRKGIEGGSNLFTVEGKIGEAREYEFRHRDEPGFEGSYIGDGVQIANGGDLEFDGETGVITNGKDLTYVPNTTKVKYLQDYVSSFWNKFEHTSVDKTYAKLREVVLTYSLPMKMLGKQNAISKIDVSFVGRNLLYFFPERFKDMDVDQYSGRTIYSSNSAEYGLQTPTTRSYGVNINVIF